LRTTNLGEADRLVTVLSPNLGKFRATVRGARRITSRLGGHMDVLNRVRLGLAHGRTIDVVTNADAQETFGPLKGDLERLAQGMYLAELTDALLPELSPHPATYNLLLDCLRALGDAPEPTVVLRYAELRLLEDAGYMPELSRCVSCGADIQPEHHRYAPAVGGVLCDACAVAHGAVYPLSVDALKVLRFFAHQSLGKAKDLHLQAALAGELEGLLGASLHQVLEREVAGGEFVELVRRLPPRVP
jgi:DNA repair protein RecO (recombination protein O)